MNQGKLNVVKQMVRINIGILRISELTWMGMGEFNSDDHYIHYCGQEILRRNGVARAQRRGCRKTSVFLSRETGISGNFVGRIKGAKCPFDLQFLTWDFS